MIDFGVIDKLIAIVFSIAILLNGYFVGKFVKTYLFPACIFSFFWFIYTFFPLVFLFDVPVNPLSIIFIFLCTLVFSLASLLFNWKKAFKRNEQKLKLPSTYFSNRSLLLMFYGLFIVTVISLIIDIQIQGFQITNFVFNFYESSNTFMAKRYNHEIVPNIFSQLANVCNYTLVMLGGVLAGVKTFSKQKKNKIAFITLLPSVFITLTQSAKGTILLSIVLFYGGILIARIFDNRLELTNRKTNKVLIIAGSFLFAIMLISFMSRGIYEETGKAVTDKLFFYFNSYSFGHVYAFSEWFSFYTLDISSIMNYKSDEGLYYGFYTFMYFFRLMGDTTYVPDGVFDEYFYHGSLFTSNIYTIFRGNVLDFGVLGSLIFWFFTGFICSTIYYSLLSLKKPIVSIPLFIMMLGYFYTSFIISLFIWKSIFAGILLLSLILIYNKILIKRKNENRFRIY